MNGPGAETRRLVSPAWEAARDALRVDPQRTRAALLCVAAGMAVIVSLVSIVAGGRREMLLAVEAAGPSNVFVRSARATLATTELAAAAARFPSLHGAAGVRVTRHELALGAARASAPIYGVSAGIADVFRFKSARGRLLGAMDHRSRSRGIVLGAALARGVSSEGDPVGRRVDAGGETYEVVGVLEALPSDTGGDLGGVDWNHGALVPLGAEPGAALAPDEDYPIDLAVLRFSDPAEAERGARLLARLEGETLSVTTAAQALAQFRAAHRSFDRVALLVSVLSTLSAAFGITNLLRASVRARAAEIGVRRAVGARQEDVRRQFLLEGLLLGVLGGALGLLVGTAAALTLLSRAGWTPVFDVGTLLLLTLGSAVFGVASGLAPAADAARLDPGAALRLE